MVVGARKIIGNSTIPAYVIRGTDISKLKAGDSTSLPLRYHTESNPKSRTLQKRGHNNRDVQRKHQKCG